MFTRRRTVVIVSALLLALAVGYGAWAGPLSDTEVIQRVGGIPVPFANITCLSSIVTPSAALPTNTLIRISTEGGLVYYRFDADNGQGHLYLTASLSTGVLLPQAAVEYIQNGGSTYFSCITRSGVQATASLATMQ